MASSVWRRFLITQFRHQPRIFCHAKSKCDPNMFIKTFIHGKSFRYCRQFCFYSTNTSPEETHESPDLQQKEQQTLQKLDHLLKNIKQKLPDSRMLNELMDMGDKLELSNRRNTYDVLIKALCKENYMDLASAALERMLNVGCIPQTSTFYPFISVYCENNQMDKLYTLFEMMKSRGRPPDSICYNMALRKICYRKRFAEASELLEIMANHASGCRPDSITYDLMIYAACKIGKIEGALQLLGRMKEEEIRPMYGTYSHVLNGFVRVGEFDKAHLFLIQEGGKDPSMDSSNYESLIRACSNAGREKEAYDLLMEMKGKGLELLDDQLCNEVLEKHNVD